MIKIVITGISGRMGKRIGLLAIEDKDFQIIGAIEVSSSPFIGKDIGEVLGVNKLNRIVQPDISKIKDQYDIILDFTTPQATTKYLDDARKKKVGIVIGTTGFTTYEMEMIKKSSSTIPIVYSPNMSIGANLLFELVEEVAKDLGSEYEVEIIEAHHNKKKDAPSGTAKRLGEAVSNVRGKVPPIHSIRIGDIVGDHTVVFAGDGERIELTHKAHSRDAFAKGALNAAKFLYNRKPGLYSMHDVIKFGLRVKG
ncbi:MAG: 4-hydroxy-tetrahydrodipicolinate reductase [Candidatus Omnitrophota bacterium]